jgi:hypothetical protein
LRQDPPTTPRISELLQNLLKRPFSPRKLPETISFDSKLHFPRFLCPNSQNSLLFLFMQSYITIVCCIIFIWSIVCFALGNYVSELLFEDFQQHVFEEPEAFLSGQQGKCLDRGLQPWRCQFSTYHSPIFPTSCLPFPPKGPPSLQFNQNLPRIPRFKFKGPIAAT